MPILIEQPVCFRDAAVLGDEIREFVGRISTGDTDISIGLLSFPGGWSEPPQRPEFDEYSIVFDGTLYVDTESAGTFRVKAGQGILTPKGERIQYRTPEPGGAKYLAVCLPAFAPELTHREEEGVFMPQTQRPNRSPDSGIASVSRPTFLHGAGRDLRLVEEYFGRFNGNATDVGISRMIIHPGCESLFLNVDYRQFIGVLSGEAFFRTEKQGIVPLKTGQMIVIDPFENYQCLTSEPGGATFFHICLPARSLNFELFAEISEDKVFIPDFAVSGTRKATTMDDRFDRIRVNQDVLDGQPFILDHYIPVGEIVRKSAQGRKIEEIMYEYPGLVREDVEQALDYALEFGNACFLPNAIKDDKDHKDSTTKP